MWKKSRGLSTFRMHCICHFISLSHSHSHTYTTISLLLLHSIHSVSLIQSCVLTLLRYSYNPHTWYSIHPSEPSVPCSWAGYDRGQNINRILVRVTRIWGGGRTICLRPICDNISYLVHYFGPWPIVLWSKLVHYVGNRVLNGTYPYITSNVTIMSWRFDWIILSVNTPVVLMKQFLISQETMSHLGNKFN